MRRGSGILLPACLALASCGGGGGGGSATAPTVYPNVIGTYASSVFYSVQLRRLSDGATASGSCPGSMTINAQSSSSFSGAFNFNCSGSITSGSVSGTVRVDGGVTFGVTVPGSDPNTFTALTDCVRASGDTAINGVAIASSLTASAIAVLDCPPPDNGVSATIQFFGNRS